MTMVFGLYLTLANSIFFFAFFSGLRVTLGLGLGLLGLQLRLGLGLSFTFTSFLPSLLHSCRALLLRHRSEVVRYCYVTATAFAYYSMQCCMIY